MAPSVFNFDGAFCFLIMSKKKPKAVALYSGGLDSTLAILVMMSHGVEIEALKFLTHFGCDIDDSSSCGSNPYLAAEQFGFNVKLSHLGWKFVDIVKSPRFGHGKNMNPCIDCRLLMLKEAGEYREMIGADFIITGEVLGQRPMSQLKNTINLIERKSGLDRRLVRPLSGRLLRSTLPEKEGLIKREWLLDLNGRSRKGQMELAEKFGLKAYTSPASGCLLTDKYYSKKLKDLLDHEENFDFNDLNILNIGRHFRLSEKCRLIVGRDEKENDAISSLIKDSDIILEAENTGSPISLLRGDANTEIVELAASITARYSDDKYQDSVTVDITQDSQTSKLEIVPIDDDVLDGLRL